MQKKKRNTFQLIKPIKDSLKSNCYSLKKVQTLLIFHSNGKTNFTDQMISQTQYCMHLQTSEHISQLSNAFTGCLETQILVEMKSFQNHLPNSSVQKALNSINKFYNQLKLEICWGMICFKIDSLKINPSNTLLTSPPLSQMLGISFQK